MFSHLKPMHNLKTRFKRQKSFARHSSKGFSLIELMVGLTIGLVIVGAGIVVFSSGQTSATVTNEQAKLEDASRYVQRMMQSSVGQAGYLGCLSRGGSINSMLNSPTSFLYNFAQPIYGSTGSDSGFTPALHSSMPTGSGVPDNKSDVLVFRGAGWKSFAVLTPYPGATGTTPVTVSENTLIKNGAIIAASNCTKTIIFQQTGSSCAAGASCGLYHAAGGLGSPGNSTANLGLALGGDTEVVLPTTSVYYIGTSARCLAGAVSNCPTSSLWRKDGAVAAQEMVEGVDSMKVLYRIDNGIRGGGRSLSAAAVDSASLWGSVVGMDIDFVLATTKPIGVGSQTINSTTYTDRRVRRFVSTTVMLRNRSQ